MCRTGPQALLRPAPAGGHGLPYRGGPAKERTAAALLMVDLSNMALSPAHMTE